jgi:putative ATP-dependent endonuclease of the OLD family
MNRAQVFQRLGYRAAVFMDSDKAVDATQENDFSTAGGAVIRWPVGLALEDALFQGLPEDAVDALIERAVELHGESVVDANITSKSAGLYTLADIKADRARGPYSRGIRKALGEAARMDGKKARRTGWFKTTAYMEDAAFDIVLPCVKRCTKEFKRRVVDLLKWIKSAD